MKLTIYGEPASKANSRKFVINLKNGTPMLVKSEKAQLYDRLVGEAPLRDNGGGSRAGRDCGAALQDLTTRNSRFLHNTLLDTPLTELEW